MKQSSFHQDKRLHNLDRDRLERLMQLADTLSSTPENQKMSVFLAIMQEMRTKDLTFSSDEQELLFTILTENMSENEKKKARMIRQLSSQLSKK
ncbi:MAG: hypothetical protein E7246_08125 [Lachnoclostridium sp.]|nr:hypothetical protein [Lachnoclostridium sp.]